MKRFLIFIVVILLLTSCSTKKTNFETSESVIEKTQILFRITWKSYSGRGETISKLVSKFNESQSDYNVTLISGDENLESIRTLISSEEVDLFVLPYRYVQILGKEELLEAIDITTKEKTISSKIVDLGKVDSKLYGLPWVSHSMALLYNKSLLKEAYVDPNLIVDRETFVEALEAIESKTLANGIGLVGANHNDLSWMVNQFIYGSGGTLIEDDVITINNKNTYDDISYYVNTLSQYAQPTWKDDTGIEVMKHFRDGGVAFEIQGLWGVTDIWKNGKNFEVGILPLSSIKANAEVGPMMLSYAANINEVKEDGIKSFMEFMLSKDSQEFIMNGEYSPEHDQFYPFRLPVRDDVIDSELFVPFKDFEIFIESYHFPSIDVPSPNWLSIKEEIYTQGLHRVCEGEITIEEFLNMIESEGNDIIRRKNE